MVRHRLRDPVAESEHEVSPFLRGERAVGDRVEQLVTQQVVQPRGAGERILGRRPDRLPGLGVGRLERYELAHTEHRSTPLVAEGVPVTLRRFRQRDAVLAACRVDMILEPRVEFVQLPAVDHSLLLRSREHAIDVEDPKAATNPHDQFSKQSSHRFRVPFDHSAPCGILPDVIRWLLGLAQLALLDDQRLRVILADALQPHPAARLLGEPLDRGEAVVVEPAAVAHADVANVF